MDDGFLASDASLALFLARFEDGSWPISEWRHMHHLAVAACYLAEDSFPMDRLRENIKRYNVTQGGENTPDRGYHETITRFWVEIIKRYMASLPGELSQLEIARLVVACFAARRDLFSDYYDFDVARSRDARAAWIPPSRSFDS